MTAPIASRAQLEGLRTSVLERPELLIVEYRLKGAEGQGPALLKVALSEFGERFVSFGDGPTVTMDSAFLGDLLAETFNELEIWAGHCRENVDGRGRTQ